MIGDVGGEVGLLAVLAHHHAVLLVAELGGAEPGRAVLLDAGGPARAARPARGRSRRSRRSARSEVHSSNTTPNSARSLRMSASISSRDRSSTWRKPSAPISCAAALDQGIDVGFLVPRGGVRGQPRSTVAAGLAQACADGCLQLQRPAGARTRRGSRSRERAPPRRRPPGSAPRRSPRGCPSAGRHR